MSVATRASFASVINPILTGYFQDEAAALPNFVGSRIAPLVDIDGLGGIATAQVGNSEINLFTDPSSLEPLAPESPARPTAIKDRLITMELERYGWSAQVPLQRVMAAKKNGVDYDTRAMRHVAKKLLGGYEQQVMDAIGTVGNYDYSHTTTNYQSTPSAPFERPLQEFKDAIGGDIGYEPNVIVMTPAVATIMQGIDEIRAWNGRYNHTSAGPVSRKLLTDYFQDQFGLELILAATRYTNATNVRGPVFPKCISLLRVDTGGFPCFATTWINNWLATFGGTSTDLSIAGIREIVMEDPQGLKYVGDAMYKITTDNSAAGALFTGVIT